MIGIFDGAKLFANVPAPLYAREVEKMRASLANDFKIAIESTRPSPLGETWTECAFDTQQAGPQGVFSFCNFLGIVAVTIQRRDLETYLGHGEMTQGAANYLAKNPAVGRDVEPGEIRDTCLRMANAGLHEAGKDFGMAQGFGPLDAPAKAIADEAAYHRDAEYLFNQEREAARVKQQNFQVWDY
jgi:hypothetical protein